MPARRRIPWQDIKPQIGYGIDWSDPINYGLMSCWLFNEGAGLTAFDIARKNHATHTSVTYANGRFGQTVKYGGSPAKSTISNIVPVMANNWTISGWIRWTSLVNLAPAFGFTYASAGIYLGTTTTNLKIGSNGESSGNGTTALSTGRDYHCALYWDGTKMQSYINGTFEYNVTPSGSLWKNSTSTGFANMAFNPGTFFQGQLNAVRIHQRQLTPTEILRLYSEPFAGIEKRINRMWVSVPASGGGGSFKPGWTTGATRTIGAVF